MIDPSTDTYVSDFEVALVYDLFHVAPALAAVVWEPCHTEAFRAWLQDTFDAAPVREQRWLRALYMYYGLYGGEPMSYRDVATATGKSENTVREQAARGLRYLWSKTHRLFENDTAAFEEALRVNEWPTADVSREVSLDYFLVLLDEAGDIHRSPVTPRVTDMQDDAGERRSGSRFNVNAADRRAPNLWNPDYANSLWPGSAP